MKGPSLEAIRKFKEQQERKKREEEEKKVKEKLLTLEHRASQGDRKAKILIKKIEKNKGDGLNNKDDFQVRKEPSTSSSSLSSLSRAKPVPQTKPKPKPTDTMDFDELMKLAKKNSNEIRKPAPSAPPAPPAPAPPAPTLVSKPKLVKSIKKPIVNPERPNKMVRPSASNVGIRKEDGYIRQPVSKYDRQRCDDRARDLNRQQYQQRRAIIHPPNPYRGRPSTSYGDDEDDDDEDDYYEDDYEQDDFVVDDDEDDMQAEVSRTIRSVFKYDKRRCDDRERELDRQYRAIGRVSTFEDLEREERRASKLAAAEDARAQREEEERKRLKKLRLKKS